MSNIHHEAVVESIYEDMTDELGRFPTPEELAIQVEQVQGLLDM